MNTLRDAKRVASSRATFNRERHDKRIADLQSIREAWELPAYLGPDMPKEEFC